MSRLFTFYHMLLYLNSMSFPDLFDLISSIPTTWFNSFQSSDLTKLSLMPYYPLLFNYLDCDVLPFTFHVESFEGHSQPYSREYDWLGPDFTQNTQVCYILILPAVLINPVTVRPSVYDNNCTWLGITLSASCADVITICICSARSVPAWVTPYVIKGIWIPYEYHITICITILGLSTLGLLWTFS